MLQCNANICDGYAKAMFTTKICELVPTAYSFTSTKEHICYRLIYESLEQGPE
jgi:hypothetical protein